MNELAAIFLLILSGGLFLFSRSAGASLPPLGIIDDNPPRFSQGDLDTLARTIWGEARGEGTEGMQAAANVVMNRYRAAQSSTAKARQFGATVTEICRKPYQFSAWNARDPNLGKMLAVDESDQAFRLAKQIARDALTGRLSDITGGADHYHTASVSPSWSKGQTPVAEIGSHEFYRLA
jgi:spore germination cell wall hydrolase CwlJ-like protein